MPTYEYQCDHCEHEFEKVLSMSRFDEPQQCPECGEGRARKLVSAVGVIFKGDGWTSKNDRIATQMAKKRRGLEKKAAEQKQDAGIKLVPNVEGEQTSTWADASKLARSKGKDTSGYDSRAATESKK